MKLALVFCVLFSAAFARPKHPLLDRVFVGEGEIKDWRIVGGRPANTNEHTYQCALLRPTSLTCGCWVINEYTIGTAAHCVDGGQPSQFQVRCGSNQYASGGQLKTVEKLIPHPSYSSSTINNDIALIHLTTPLTLNAAVSKVTLPAAGSDPADRTAVVATGWGRTSTNGAIPAAMQRIALTINGRTQCQSIWGSTLTANMICAGGYEGNGQGICNGDSGGALVTGTGANPTIVGTTSFRTSAGCAYQSWPEVYCRVSNYISWINSNTKN